MFHKTPAAEGLEIYTYFYTAEGVQRLPSWNQSGTKSSVSGRAAAPRPFYGLLLHVDKARFMILLCLLFQKALIS